MYNKLFDFIKQNKNNWQEVLAAEPYYLKVKQCPLQNVDNTLKYPELYMLSYNQIESNFSEEIVKLCRGCIISVEDLNTPRMVCTPFKKFFNYQEPNVDEVDWNSATVLEKVDGSLLKLFNYKGKWIWVTNNGWNINSEIPRTLVSSFNEPETDHMTTFEQLKDYAVKKHFSEESELFMKCRPNITYMFELLSPKNRIICDNSETELVVLGARDNKTFEEYTEHEILTDVAFRRPKIFELTNIDDVLALCNSYKDAFNEGVVVRDANNLRFKIKCAHYLSLKGLKGEIGFTAEKILASIRDESVDDAIGAFPEIEPLVAKIKQTCIQFRKCMDELVNLAQLKYTSCLMAVEDARQARGIFAKWVKEEYSDVSKYMFKAIDNDVEVLTKIASLEEMQEILNKHGDI